jgi:hypothetical protein
VEGWVGVGGVGALLLVVFVDFEMRVVVLFGRLNGVWPVVIGLGDRGGWMGFPNAGSRLVVGPEHEVW